MIENIQKIHEDVFNYLLKWSEDARQQNILNPFFYMRNKRDERLKKGYWFPGDDNYLVISFWLGNDSISRTPNAYFAITENGCHATLRARDSEQKSLYFDEVAAELNANVSVNYQKTFDSGWYWNKQYSGETQGYMLFLDNFINNDKAIIDKYLKRHPPEEIEEFVSDFEFIDQNRFEKMLSKVLKEREEFNNTDLQILEQFENALPFAVRKIEIENFQGIKKTSITNLPLNAQWIFITGENGYGKTSLLRSIALGLNKNPDLEDNIDDPKTRIVIEYFFQQKLDIATRLSGSWKNSNFEISNSLINSVFDIEKYCVGYGPARLNVRADSSETLEKKSRNNIASLFDNSILLRSIKYELLLSKYESLMDDDEFDSDNNRKVMFLQLKDIIKHITNDRISDIKVKNREVLFVEHLKDGENEQALPLDKIAAGFKSIINLVFDIYIRFKETGLFGDYKGYFGIVFIDEIENHLHPIMQKELPELLSEIFPKMLFIATTHSPIPLLGAPRNSVILRVNRNVENGITVERLDEEIDFYNLTPNAILTSSIFGFYDLISDFKDKDKFPRLESEYKDVAINDAKQTKISEFLSNENTEELKKLLKNKDNEAR